MSRYALAAVFVLVAAAMWFASGDRSPSPSPAPPQTALDLRGLFVGPTAADDAVTFGALCDELAEVIAYDGTLASPRLKTGTQLDDLRVAACDARMRGLSIGARQPKVRDAIKTYLDAKIGTGGGPVSVDARRAWVDAFREIARAAANATR